MAGAPGALRRLLWRATLRDPAWAFLFEPGPPGELVSLDCETTGLDPRADEVVAVAAVRVVDRRILTSGRYEALVRPESRPVPPTAIRVHGLRARDLADARPMAEVLPELLRFVGGRPILGYYVGFDAALLDRDARRLLGARLPNPRVEVSELYYDRKYGDAPPGTRVDLRLASMLADLGLPALPAHDALNDAVMAATAYLQLRDLQDRGVRLKRPRPGPADPAPIGG